MKRRTLEIHVPGLLIPRSLTPNKSRAVHFSQVTSDKNNLQRTVLRCAIDARNRWADENGIQWKPLEHATIQYRFDIPNQHHIRDDDNQIAGCKFVRDVLQVKFGDGFDGAGIVLDDKRLATLRLEWAVVPKSDIGMHITITETGKFTSKETATHCPVCGEPFEGHTKCEACGGLIGADHEERWFYQMAGHTVCGSCKDLWGRNPRVSWLGMLNGECE